MEPTSFVLDTGAEASVVDAQHAAANGITGSDNVAARGNGESTVSAQVTQAELTIAGLRMPVETMYGVRSAPSGPAKAAPWKPSSAMTYSVTSSSRGVDSNDV